MKWLANLIPGGSLVTGAIEIGKKFLGNQRREQRIDAELKSDRIAAKARRRRTLIKASPWPLRIIAFVAWFLPFAAPAWPGVTVAMTMEYVDNVISGMPDWYINIGLLMYGFIWGGSEWKSLQAQRDDERLAEKEVERDTERERNRQHGERPGPPGGGGR